MFNLDIGRKQRMLEAVESRYDQARIEAENLGLTGYDLRDNLAELWSHVVLAREEYQKVRSQRIIQRARRLEIPIPEINDSDGTWGRGTTEGYFLTAPYPPFKNKSPERVIGSGPGRIGGGYNVLARERNQAA